LLGLVLSAALALGCGDDERLRPAAAGSAQSTIPAGAPVAHAPDVPDRLDVIEGAVLEAQEMPTEAEPATLTSDHDAGGKDLPATRDYVDAVVRHATSVWTTFFVDAGLDAPSTGHRSLLPGATYTSECRTPTGIRTFGADFPNAMFCRLDPIPGQPNEKGMLILPLVTLSKMWTGEIFTRKVDDVKRTGDFAAGVIVAHEYGHSVADELAEQTGAKPPISPGRELIADCFAGVWAYNVFLDEYLEDGDIDEAINALGVIGDDLGSHGTGAERQNAFLIGYSGTEAEPGGGVPGKCVDNYWQVAPDS
jgi:hypothetical protein